MSMKASRATSNASLLRTTLCTAVVLALLASLPLAAASSGAAGSPSPDLVTPPWSAWAYTGLSVSTGSGSVSSPGGNFTYAFHGAFGEAVVLGQTNTSATTYLLQGTETLGSTYFVSLCTPSCQNPNGEANITLFSWMQDTSYANLTTTATVSVNGTATPALGLVNDNSIATGNMTRLLQFTYRGSSGGWLRGGSSTSGFSYGSAAMHGDETLSFSPSAGLQPLSVTPGEAWSSTSAYTGSLSTSGSYHLYSSRGGPTGSGTPSFSGSASGNLTLLGGDLGQFQLDGGLWAHRVAWQYSAPFTFWDGIFLVPAGANLFLGSGHAWESSGNLGVMGSPSSSDYAPSVAHRGWVAGATSFVPDEISVPAGGGGGGPGGGLGLGMALPVGGSAPSGPSGVALQTEPDSVADAQSLAGALVQAPVFLPLAPLPGGHPGIALVVLVVLVAAVVVLVVVVRRRKNAEARPIRSSEYAGYSTSSGGSDDDDRDIRPSKGTAEGDDGFQDLL